GLFQSGSAQPAPELRAGHGSLQSRSGRPDRGGDRCRDRAVRNGDPGKPGVHSVSQAPAQPHNLAGQPLPVNGRGTAAYIAGPITTSGSQVTISGNTHNTSMANNITST